MAAPSGGYDDDSVGAQANDVKPNEPNEDFNATDQNTGTSASAELSRKVGNSSEVEILQVTSSNERDLTAVDPYAEVSNSSLSSAASSRKRKCHLDSEAQEHGIKASADEYSTKLQLSSNPTTSAAAESIEEEMRDGSTGGSEPMRGVKFRDNVDNDSSDDEQEQDQEQRPHGNESEGLISEAELESLLEAPPPSCSTHMNVVLKLRDRERLFSVYRPRQSHTQASASVQGFRELRTIRSHREELQGSLALVRRLKLHTRLARHDGCVNALNFSESGALLASGSDDLRVVCWDWQRKRVAFEFSSGHTMNVFQTRFVPGSADLLLATCARDGQVRLAELSSTGKCMRTRRLVRHRAAAHKLSTFNDDSHMLLSCGEDAVVCEIDLRHDQASRLMTVKSGSQKIALYSVHVNPSNSNEFCVAGRDSAIRVYDRRFIASDESAEDSAVKLFCPRIVAAAQEDQPADSDGARRNRSAPIHVTCAVYNYNGTQILGSYNDEDIYLFDCRPDYADEFARLLPPPTAACQQATANDAGETRNEAIDSRSVFKGHRNSQTVKGVNFYGPQSQFVVSGSDCGYMFIWDVNSTRLVHCAHADQIGAVNVLEPHPHLPILATSGLEHDVKLWYPTASEPSDLTRLANLDGISAPRSVRSVMANNLKSRREESVFAVDLDSEMLWYLMRQLRRSMHSRERARQEPESSTDEEDSDDSQPDDDPNTTASGQGSRSRRPQLRPCITS